MTDNQSAKSNNSSDEIDLGQLFQLIGKGFNVIFRFILRVFLYLKKNIFILIGLVVLGLAIGYGLNQVISKRLKIEVIVKPQAESKNYLYDAINEIQANIKAKDTLFFNSIGLEEVDFKGLEVTVKRVVEEETSESDIKYLELLQSFENTDAIADIVKEELENKSSFNHRITFFFKNTKLGKEFADKVLEYINGNEYFKRLVKVSRDNAQNRIEANQLLLKQVDEIIANYTNSLAAKENSSISERIILDNQEQVNIADLFEYKNRLIRDIELKRLELEEQKEPISIMNFGTTQVVQKPFFVQNVFLAPIIFLISFFLISFLIYLNRKSSEVN